MYCLRPFRVEKCVLKSSESIQLNPRPSPLLQGFQKISDVECKHLRFEPNAVVFWEKEGNPPCLNGSQKKRSK